METLLNGQNLCVKETNAVSLVRMTLHRMVISSKLYQGTVGDALDQTRALVVISDRCLDSGEEIKTN